MSRSLVLNATYEPLGIVSNRRAVLLVLAEKAEVVHHAGGELRSARVCVPIPSVIRLRYYVKVPYRRHTALSRRAVFLRDGGRCQYCGRRADSVDHVVPRSRGGTHTWDNVVAACSRCNASKRDHLLEETHMRLRCRPGPPRNVNWMVVAVDVVPAHWEPYLHLHRDGDGVRAARTAATP
jgi:5-methylcytosine-specific restriction endonuclease McrA